MPSSFDFIVVGGGSAGAVIAARLSEDPNCQVALIEAGKQPPETELIPAACASLQLSSETDWMYTADPGKAGLGLQGGRVPVPRGKMLGGSSSINYMAYVRGHPGDFDSWAAGGASGWSYDEVLPYFKKIEELNPSDEIVIDKLAHGDSGPVGISVRSPALAGAKAFVAAAEAAGIPRGDYNGRDRGGATGVVSLLQTNTRQGRRASTYRAFLENAADRRPNLSIIIGAQATRILLEDDGTEPRAKGVEYRTEQGQTEVALADREVILSAGAVGSPHLLMLSGIGPREDIEKVGVRCVVDSPHVGKHLKDHIQVPLFFPAPGIGLSMMEVGLSMGPDALRQPNGPLPADPADDDQLSPELLALKQEAERRLAEWESTGEGLISSSLYDAASWFSTGLGDHHSHDGQISFIPCGYNYDLWHHCLRIDTDRFFDDPAQRLAPDSENVLVLANPVLPHSEGEIALQSSDPANHPVILMNYYEDDHDLKVMVAVVRRALEIVDHWPQTEGRPGPMMVPPRLAEMHGYQPGEAPSDELLEDIALHFSLTVYHLSCTCRIGDVVDPVLRVKGVSKLRVADASIMPNIVSGNTNATSIMIGEKAAELIAVDHGVKLAEFVGSS